MNITNFKGTYPFASQCPICGGPIDGLVDGQFCLNGGGPFSEKVTGLIQHWCKCCGNSIGVRLRIGVLGVEIVESGAYVDMLGNDMEALLRMQDDT